MLQGMKKIKNGVNGVKAVWAGHQCSLEGMLQDLLPGLIRPIELTEADPAQICSAWSPEEGSPWASAAVMIEFLMLGVQECSHLTPGE